MGAVLGLGDSFRAFCTAGSVPARGSRRKFLSLSHPPGKRFLRGSALGEAGVVCQRLFSCSFFPRCFCVKTHELNLWFPRGSAASHPVLVVPSTTLLIGNLEMERVLISKPPPPHPSPPAGDRRGCLSKANKQIPPEHLNEPGPGTTQLKNGSYWLFFCDGGNNPGSKRVYSEGAPRGLFAARYCCQKPNKSSAEGSGGREVIKKKKQKNTKKHSPLPPERAGRLGSKGSSYTQTTLPGFTTHFRFLFLNVAIFNDVITSNPCFPGSRAAGTAGGSATAAVEARGKPRQGLGARLSELMILLSPQPWQPRGEGGCSLAGNLERCFGVILKWGIKQQQKSPNDLQP